MSEASSHKPLPATPAEPSSSAGPRGSSSSARALSAVPGERTVISSKPPAPDLDFRGAMPFESISQWEGEQLGQFVLQKFIGGGGMGIVFRALDTTLDRDVAVKVLSADQSADEETLRRFRNEAQSAARLNHDNIAHVFYVGEDRGVHYIVFEFIEGVNIRDLVEQHGSLPLDEAVSYTYQIAQALEHASQRAVIHRDIKPSNVLITPDGKAKLVDMGLARLSQLARADDLTASGVTLGTFDYISPEQARDPRSADVRSDLYSLGCSFFFMLTGRPPFPDGTVLQKLLQHQGDSPPDPREFRPDLPADVTQILARLLAKNPAQRYQTPAELIGDLSALADALGIQLGGARSAWVTPRRHYRFSQWQHHLPWGISIVVLLITVLALDYYWSVEPVELPSTTSAARANRAAPAAPLPPVDAPESSVPDRDDPSGTSEPAPRDPTTDGSSQPESLDTAIPDDTNKAIAEPWLSLARRIREAAAGNALPGADSATSSSRPTGDPLKRPAEHNAEIPRAAASTTTTLPRRDNVLVVGDVTRGAKYASLHAACSEAKDGDIVELRFNGRLTEHRPIEISNVKLALRAAANYEPIVVFQPESDWTTKYDPVMIRVAGGQLSADNVHWELNLPRNDPADWALFESRSSERLEFSNCTLTVRGQTDYAARVTFFDAKAAPRPVSMGMGEPVPDSQDRVVAIHLYNCVARGEATFLRDNDLQPVRLRWEDGLLATSERLLVAEGDSLEPSQQGTIDVTLDHVTAMTAGGFVLLANSAESLYLLPTSVTCNDCILATTGRAPFVEQRGPDGILDYQRRFTWHGERDFFYGYDVFWLIMNSSGQSGSQRFDFDAWDQYWGSQSGAEAAGTGAVVWNQLPPADRPFHMHSRFDYALDGTAADNAAAGGARNNMDAGGPIIYLPQLPDQPSDEPVDFDD